MAADLPHPAALPHPAVLWASAHRPLLAFVVLLVVAAVLTATMLIGGTATTAGPTPLPLLDSACAEVRSGAPC